MSLYSAQAFAGERVIINPEQDSDIKIKVNRAGTIYDALRVDAANNRVVIGDSTLNAGNSPVIQSGASLNLNLTSTGSGNETNVTYNRNGSSQYQIGVNNVDELFWYRYGSVNAGVGKISPAGLWTIGKSGETGTHTVNGNITASNLVSTTSFSSTASNIANLDSTPTIAGGQAMKVGSVVTYSFRVPVDPTTISLATSFNMTIPYTTTNFTQTYEANGNCTSDPVGGTATHSFVIAAVASAQTISIYTGAVNFTAARNLHCIVTYRI
jgi:hypothetical protein